MPKRGRPRGNNRVWNNHGDKRGPRDSRHEGGKYYNEHDEGRQDFARRVSFKAGAGASNRVGKARRDQADWNAQLQVRLAIAEDDVDAGNQAGLGGRTVRLFNPYVAGRGRGRRRGGRQNSPTPVVQRRQHHLVESSTGWYKVMVPYGNEYEKEYVLTTLQNLIAPITLTPFLYKPSGLQSSFYVDNLPTAEAVMKVDRKATTAEGYKLLTRVRPGLPPLELNSDVRERMKAAMAPRYNPENKALDLHQFHMDPSLREDLVVALSRNDIMMSAIDVAVENIPDLSALNLSNNNLQTIDHLSCLATKMPALCVLHLARNKIRDVRQIESLGQLKLVDLVLEGNPLCTKFRDHAVYVRCELATGRQPCVLLVYSEVTKRFPKLRKLDNVELPPPIVFDTGEEEAHIPPYAGSYLISEGGVGFLRHFLEQYFRIYDGDSREPLGDAYHEHATFSMAAAANKENRGSKLDAYLPLSRNLLRIIDPASRSKRLVRGKTSIVAFLNELPKTQHDALSFAVDMPVFSPQLIQVSVCGVFRERETRHNPLRSFSRTFVVVPVNAGFCIINETMFVTNVTELQTKSAFKVSTPTAPARGDLAPADLALRTQMVQALSQQTDMNATWANKCLEETGWKFELAVAAFVELNKARAIPAEAFVK